MDMTIDGMVTILAADARMTKPPLSSWSGARTPRVRPAVSPPRPLHRGANMGSLRGGIVPAHDPSSGARHRAAAVRRQRTSIAAAGRQHRHEHWRVDRHVRACSRIETRREGRSMRTASRDGSPIPDPSESVSADPAAPAFARSSFQRHPVPATRSHCRSTTQNT